MTVTRALLERLAQVVRSAFHIGVPPHSRRVGLELELLVLDARCGAPAALAGRSGLIAAVRRHGSARGWVEEPSSKGAPRFRLPGGGALTFEPGGQIEISTPALPGVGLLLEVVRALVQPLRADLLCAGFVVKGEGVDPINPLERAPLQVRGERYLRMDCYFRSIGPWGARMMRQTAALQINLDFGADPQGDWRLLNAAAPYLAGAFANSPRYAGEPAGIASFRRRVWEGTDPARTGILTGDPGVVADYERFALAAPAILAGAGGEWPPFGELLARGEVGEAEWEEHLSTLFPEVRPRGHLELRALDMLPLRWLAAPVAIACGLLYDADTRAIALELLGDPQPGLLPASANGLRDPRLAARAGDLVELGLRGCARLGDFVPFQEQAIAHDFAERYTFRGLTPADDFMPPAPVELPRLPLRAALPGPPAWLRRGATRAARPQASPEALADAHGRDAPGSNGKPAA